jgi:hypothetical protein
VACPPERVTQSLSLSQAGSRVWIAREVSAPQFASLYVALRVANLFKSEDCDAGKTLRAHKFIVDDACCWDGDAFSLEMILTDALWEIVGCHAYTARSEIFLREARDGFKRTSARAFATGAGSVHPPGTACTNTVPRHFSVSYFFSDLRGCLLMRQDVSLFTSYLEVFDCAGVRSLLLRPDTARHTLSHHSQRGGQGLEPPSRPPSHPEAREEVAP